MQTEQTQHHRDLESPANLRSKILDFRGFDSSQWHFHVHMESPGNFGSANLSRDNLSREVGREPATRYEASELCVAPLPPCDSAELLLLLLIILLSLLLLLSLLVVVSVLLLLLLLSYVHIYIYICRERERDIDR